MLDSFKEARKTGLSGVDLHEKIDEIQREKDTAAKEIAKIEEEFSKATGFQF
jgi:lipid II:glycine glycyltransferase (peptidoglycan interpeptide bridge formation enzyme)